MAFTPPPPTIALVGRPNVGKSTLFNRLAGGRRALVAATPGVTRDRREETVHHLGYHFRLVDTGGLAFDKDAAFAEAVAGQVEAGLAGADCVWLVGDATEGLNPYDQELYRGLLRRGKPVMVVVNKVDNARREERASEFFALGTGDVFPVSALHGTGVEKALARAAEMAPGMAAGSQGNPPGAAGQGVAQAGLNGAPPLAGDAPLEPGPHPQGPICFSLLGRPNVGKSSLANRMLGAARMIVSDIPGTTREALELPLAYQGREFLLIDTAGIRRKARTKEHVEKIGALNAIGSLGHAQVGVVVLDATEPAADQDARIARYVLEQRRALVVVLNKWDRVSKTAAAAKELEEDARYKLRFAGFAGVVRASAATGMGLEQVFREILAAHGEFTRRIQTADLNRVVSMSVLRRAPPARGHSQTKIFYGSQVRHSPPTFCFFTNHIEAIGENYTRFMEHQLRYHFGLKGTPLEIFWRARTQPEKRPRPRPRTGAARGPAGSPGRGAGRGAGKGRAGVQGSR